MDLFNAEPPDPEHGMLFSPIVPNDTSDLLVPVSPTSISSDLHGNTATSDLCGGEDSMTYTSKNWMQSSKGMLILGLIQKTKSLGYYFPYMSDTYLGYLSLNMLGFWQKITRQKDYTMRIPTGLPRF